MAVTDLNKVIYVDAEFNTAVDAIQTFLNTEFPDEFNDYVNANIGQALIDIIAYAEQNLMWYLNRKVTDLYFPTAVTPNAVSKIARMLGYKPKSATFAEVPITMTLKKGPYNFSVIINKGQQFRGPNKTVWEYRGDVAVVFQPGDLTKTFTVGQGQTITSSFLSNGTNNQVFDLRAVPSTKFVASDGFLVNVDGVSWDEYPIIPYDNITAFETNLLSTPPSVKFGDSVQGKVPPQGSTIQVKCVVTDGFKGRILSGGITEPVGNIVANFQNIPVTITQPSASVGGDDPEDLRSIVVNAPLFQKTQDRAITKGDYDFLSNQYDNVARADAQIVRGVSGDVTINALLDGIMEAVTTVGASFELAAHPHFLLMEADLGVIEEAVSSFGASIIGVVTPLITSSTTSLTSIKTQTNAQLATLNTAVAVLTAGQTSAANAIDTLLATEAGNLDTIVAIRQSNIASLLSSIKTIVDASSAVSGDKASVDSLITQVTSKVSELRSAVATEAGADTSLGLVQTNIVRSDVASITTLLQSVSGNIEGAVSGYRNSVLLNLANISSSVTSGVSGFVSSTSGAMLDMESQFAMIDGIINTENGLIATVSGYRDMLFDYLDASFTDGCKANLVQVSVLAKDANRKYVSPLQSTLDGLKTYLDARKDAVHTISVISGTNRVINANIKITVKVSQNAVEDDVVKSMVDSLAKSDAQPFGILVERAFNSPLYNWEIDSAIKAAVVPNSQIIYADIEITGPVEYLDVGGNLIPPDGYVIQAGTITVVKLARF